MMIVANEENGLSNEDKIERLVLSLQFCRKRFEEYFLLHMAKGTEDAFLKARSNQAMVEFIDSAIKAYGQAEDEDET